MIKPVPKILYKYRCFNGRSLSMLANNQIYFASPRDFNDPFDCGAHEHMLDDLREDTLEALARAHPDVSPESVTKENTQRFKEAFHQHPEIIQIKEKLKVDHEEFLNSEGVLSLSERNDSILMWSHYANDHKGFCIGFENSLGLDGLMEVEYSEDRGNDLIKEFLLMQAMSPEGRQENVTKLYLLRKHIDWRYEQEWRALRKQGLMEYDDEHLYCVIFGMKMPEDERKVIRILLKGKKVKFFEAVKNTRYFSLDIKQID